MRLTEDQYADLMRKRSASAPERPPRGERKPAGTQAPAEVESAPEGRHCVVLPWPPAELWPNSRPHWGAKSRAVKKYRNACDALALDAKLAALDGPIYLWIDFLPPDRRRRDVDNCVAAMKSGLDGLADALGVDDSRFVLRPMLCEQIGGMVRVRLTGGPE